MTNMILLWFAWHVIAPLMFIIMLLVFVALVWVVPRLIRKANAKARGLFK